MIEYAGYNLKRRVENKSRKEGTEQENGESERRKRTEKENGTTEREDIYRIFKKVSITDQQGWKESIIGG